MKKIFIVLLMFGFLFFIPLKSTASFADDYGTNLTYKTLQLLDDFNYINYYEEQVTYVFQFRPIDESLRELLGFWDDSSWDDNITNFMKIYSRFSINNPLEYLNDVSDIPTNIIAWSSDDIYIYIIVEKDYLDNIVDVTDKNLIDSMFSVLDLTMVDTWIISSTTGDYEEGYNKGFRDGSKDSDLEYERGYNQGSADGFNEGFNVGYTDGFSDGYDDGDNDGYSRGLNEGTTAWGVLFSTMLTTFGTILGIEIFPGLSIGMLASVPLILGLLAFIIGVARGGKRND